MDFQTHATLLKQGRDAFWSILSENGKNRHRSRPKFSRPRLSSDFFVNLEGVSPVVREKVKNETVATFYDVYDVFGPNFHRSFNFPSGLKVNYLFKAKKVAFRERNHAKVEKSTFCIPQSQKILRDFSVFEEKSWKWCQIRV